MARKRWPRDPKTGRYLTKRQIAARRARKSAPKKRKRKAGGKNQKTEERTMAKKKRRRRRRGGGGRISKKQKQDLCMTSAALGYLEENTTIMAKVPMHDEKPAKKHLVWGLVAHFGAASGMGGKWLDLASAAWLCVGAHEAGQAKFQLEGGSEYDVIEAEVSGECD